ncbi:hypothetical protein Bbelb_190270 [Branchiostoma belcheri]|nr:hypothetical protein Bbelb_190270 [Branchiostoma belcheri]
MSAIPLPAFDLFLSIITIDLDGNPWQCDCSMAPVRRIPALKDQIICAQPDKVQGKKLTDVNPEKLVCEQPTVSTLAPDIQVTSNTSYDHSFHWHFHSTTSPAGKARATLTSTTPLIKPETTPSSPLPTSILIGSVCGPVAGIALIGALIVTVWYKKRFRPSGPNPNVVGGNQVALKVPKPQYATVGTKTRGQRAYTEVADDQTGQAQSQAITKSNTNTTANAMVSGDDHHQYEDIDNRHVKAEQDYSKAIAESNTKTNTVMTSGDDQTGQGKGQANTGTYLSYDTGTTASELNSLYKAATVMTSGDDQAGQGQSQSVTVANLSHNEAPNPVYVPQKEPTSEEIVNSHD